MEKKCGENSNKLPISIVNGCMKLILLNILLLATAISAFAQTRGQLLAQAEVAVTDSNYGKAINLYDKQLAADSADYEVYQKRGDLYMDMKDFQQAFKDYSYSIHYNARYWEAWVRRAQLLTTLDYYDKAINDYNTALPLAENNDIRVLILTNRGEAWRHLDQWEEAAKDFQSALGIDSTNLAVLADLGNTFFHLKRSTEGIAYLEKAIAIDSTFEGGIGNLAFAYAEMGNYAKSIELNNRMLRLKPNDPYSLNNRGYAKMQMGDLDGGLEDINNSILKMPYNSYAFRNRALLHIKQHKKAEACADLNKALELGFSKEYGSEVEDLIKKYCQSDEKTNKM